MRSAARWLITGPMLTSVNGSPTVKSWAAFTKALVNLPKSSGSPPTKRCCCKQEFQITNYLLVCSATLVPDPPFSAKTRVCNRTAVGAWTQARSALPVLAVLPRNVVNGVSRDGSFWPVGSRRLCTRLGESQNCFLVASPGIWRVSQIDVRGKFHQRPIRVVQCRGDHVGGGILGDDLTSVECDEDSGKS